MVGLGWGVKQNNYVGEGLAPLAVQLYKITQPQTKHNPSPRSVRVALRASRRIWVIYTEAIYTRSAISLPYGFAVRDGVPRGRESETMARFISALAPLPFGGKRFLRDSAVGVS